jgi:hypothetical protein
MSSQGRKHTQDDTLYGQIMAEAFDNRRLVCLLATKLSYPIDKFDIQATLTWRWQVRSEICVLNTTNGTTCVARD